MCACAYESSPGSTARKKEEMEDEGKTPSAAAAAARSLDTVLDVAAATNTNLPQSAGQLHVHDNNCSKLRVKEGEHATYCSRRRKTRRGKAKRRNVKPYSKTKAKDPKKRAGGQPPAPYNTTQFIMADHDDLRELEEKLAENSESTSQQQQQQSNKKPPALPRTRDSSFSVDSEEDYFYSSPEDEEEFLTKEFSTAYESLHAERLNTLPKTQLIQEYVQLEAKVDILTKRLRCRNFCQMDECESKCTDEGRKLKGYQQRIEDLMRQNEQLKRENEGLKQVERFESRMSSGDLSESTSNGNLSNCSCGYHRSKKIDKAENKENTLSDCSADSESDSCSSSSDSSDEAQSLDGDKDKEVVNGFPT